MTYDLSALYGRIAKRKAERQPGSYTTYLFDKGADTILKKTGAIATEVVIAGKGGDKPETIYKIADLAFHILALMAELGITPEDVAAELESRRLEDRE